MDRKIFIEKLFARAAEEGMTQCQASYSSGESFEVSVLKGEVLSYNVSDVANLSFRALVNGRMGSASTQALDDEAIEMLVASAKINAELVDSDDEEFMYDGSGEYAKVENYVPAIDEVSAADKIAFAREMEEKTLARDSRMDQLEDCAIFSESSEYAIVNTLGLNVSCRSNMLAGYVAPVARDGEKVSSGMKMFVSADGTMDGSDEAIDEAVKEAVDYLYADSVPSGEYPAIFRYDAMRTLLSTFAGVFSAENAQKGLSRLNGREGDRIASECVTIVDDPHMALSASSAPFDGEGVPTRYKEIIKSGVLETLMHNLKTAHKQGVASTGNAAHGSADGISFSNLYVAPGEKSFDDMVSEMGDGLVICSLQGAHAGADAISGDFSLSARGYRVENGRIADAVKQITVAGNFYDILSAITSVGSDLKFGLPGNSRVGSPSVMVKKISVAGK